MLPHFLREFQEILCVFLLTLRTLQEVAGGLVPFRGKPIIIARWAGLVDRFIIRDEIAFGIARTAIECPLRFAAFALDNVANRTLGALDTGRYLSCIFTCGIAAATDELPEAARTQKQFAFFAVGTDLAELFRRRLVHVLDRCLLEAIGAIKIKSEPT